jgi:hypothetical protein
MMKHLNEEDLPFDITGILVARFRGITESGV